MKRASFNVYVAPDRLLKPKVAKTTASVCGAAYASVGEAP